VTATATIVVDLGFGDAGKGSIVDAVVRRRQAGGVVRFNGGCQAAHNVVDDQRVNPAGGPVQHVFSQFGAGTFAGAVTHLSRFMMVEPMSLFNEAEHLTEQCGIGYPLSLLTVDPRALVTTPLHKLANQAKERARGVAGHGSCGRGIGETVEHMLQRPLEALRVRDLWHDETTLHKLAAIDEYYAGLELGLGWLDAFEAARRRFVSEVTLAYDRAVLTAWRADMEHIVFEGAQGVLIDETYGFAPYYTWSNCTFDNAMTLLAEAGFPRDDISRMGVTRAYMVRHGAGPLPTEDAKLTHILSDRWNVTNDWQGAFRVGYFDLPLVRYAIDSCRRSRDIRGVDELAITCLDRLNEVYSMEASRTIDIHPDGRSIETHPLRIQGRPGLKVCVAYKHRQWGLFDVPVSSLPLHGGSATKILEEMEPVFQPAPENFPRWLEDRLDVPATILSYGPSAAGKSWLHPAIKEPQ
jgi:adenylosuccinate synthase